MDEFIQAMRSVNNFADEQHTNVAGVSREKMIGMKKAFRAMEHIGTDDCQMLELFIKYDIDTNSG